MFDLMFMVTAAQFFTGTVTDAIRAKSGLFNKSIIYLGENYRIQSVEILSGATLFRIGCVSQNQNA